MFETNNGARVNMPIEFREPDEQAWWYIKLSLHIPWFYVTCEIDYGNDERLIQMLFIAQVKHLIEANRSKTIKIKQVDLVIPSRISGEEKWTMGSLSEIWVGREPEIEHYQEAFIFILDDGKQYIDTALNTVKNDLLDLKKVFPLN